MERKKLKVKRTERRKRERKEEEENTEGGSWLIGSQIGSLTQRGQASRRLCECNRLTDKETDGQITLLSPLSSDL